MSDNRAPRETYQPLVDTGTHKKPYQKPAFRSERVFETQALSCGKIGITQGQCQAGTQKTS